MRREAEDALMVKDRRWADKRDGAAAALETRGRVKKEFQWHRLRCFQLPETLIHPSQGLRSSTTGNGTPEFS